MDIIVSYAFAHIVEAIILWMSMSQMYDQRYKQWVTGMVIMAGHTVMFGIFLIGNIYVVTVVNIIVYMILIYKLYNINKTKCCILGNNIYCYYGIIRTDSLLYDTIHSWHIKCETGGIINNNCCSFFV